MHYCYHQAFYSDFCIFLCRSAYIFNTLCCGALLGVLLIDFLNTYALNLHHTFMSFRCLAADCPITLNFQAFKPAVSNYFVALVSSGDSSNSLHLVPNLVQYTPYFSRTIDVFLGRDHEIYLPSLINSIVACIKSWLPLV